MSKISFIMDHFLWNYVKTGFTVLMIVTALIIIASVIFTAAELRKAGRREDAQKSAADDGGMSAPDDTD